MRALIEEKRQGKPVKPEKPANDDTKVVDLNRYFPPDTQAAIFWLRNRRRKQWREVIEHEHTGSDEKLQELEKAGIRARNAYRR